MGRFLTTRRAEWAPGLAILGTSVGISALIGVSLALRSWPIYVGLVATILLGVGALERFLARRRALSPPRGRARLRMIRGGKPSPLDLENDDTTKNQRYLM